jgi:hypothetical protein
MITSIDDVVCFARGSIPLNNININVDVARAQMVQSLGATLNRCIDRESGAGDKITGGI